MGIASAQHYITLADIAGSRRGITRGLITLKALSNPLRLRIFLLLKDHGPFSGPDLARQLPPDLAPSTLATELSALRRAGLVAAKKSGRKVRYSIGTGELKRACDFFQKLRQVEK